MKLRLTSFLLISLASFCRADDAVKQITKVSQKELNVEAEIKAFYI